MPLEHYVGGPLGLGTNVQNCNIVVSMFELQWRYFVHFRTKTLGKDMKPPAICKIVLLLFFNKNGFGIK